MITLFHVLAATNLTPGDVPNLPMAHADQSTFTVVLQIVFGIIGAFALLMVTVSGLRYVLSGGDPQKVARAKNGIIYSLVGVAIAITAESIVGFVIGRL
jgi:hypothetical protein